jgi:hypothetical protein
MKIVRDKDQFRVVHSPSFQFVVPRDLAGLLRGVNTPKTDFLRAGSAGLAIRTDAGSLVRVGGKAAVARVIKEGPLASTLRFESTEQLRDGRSVGSTVDMEFPLSKSWVRVTWTVKDPDSMVAGLDADLKLNVEGDPTLVDFGAGSYVYAHLRKRQRAIMRHHGHDLPWETRVGPVEAPSLYVVATQRRELEGSEGAAKHRKPVYSKAEGWAHVMDRKRCTAVAVADFAGSSPAELVIDADGRLQIGKRFPGKGRKTLRFWLHFVAMPVQVGAVTSPQSMMAPLEVEVRP